MNKDFIMHLCKGLISLLDLVQSVWYFIIKLLADKSNDGIGVCLGQKSLLLYHVSVHSSSGIAVFGNNDTRSYTNSWNWHETESERFPPSSVSDL